MNSLNLKLILPCSESMDAVNVRDIVGLSAILLSHKPTNSTVAYACKQREKKGCSAAAAAASSFPATIYFFGAFSSRCQRERTNRNSPKSLLMFRCCLNVFLHVAG